MTNVQKRRGMCLDVPPRMQTPRHQDDVRSNFFGGANLNLCHEPTSWMGEQPKVCVMLLQVFISLMPHDRMVWHPIYMIPPQIFQKFFQKNNVSLTLTVFSGTSTIKWLMCNVNKRLHVMIQEWLLPIKNPSIRSRPPPRSPQKFRKGNP